MPRQARLDAPGVLHHVMVRGIEKCRIVDDGKDRRGFVSGLVPDEQSRLMLSST
jgi:putative transposase